jgi:hypothetical protein
MRGCTYRTAKNTGSITQLMFPNDMMYKCAPNAFGVNCANEAQLKNCCLSSNKKAAVAALKYKILFHLLHSKPFQKLGGKVTADKIGVFH